MHARRGAGDHFRLARRQGIEGIFGELVTTAAANPLGFGDLTTLFDGPTSLLVFPSSSTTTTSSDTTTTTTSSSATTSSHPNTLQTLTPSSQTPLPASASTPTSSDYGVHSVTSGTSIVYVTTTVPSPSSTNVAPKSFFQNPALEGGVFTAVGVVALILLFVLVTWTIRKRRHDRVDAITFDPGMTGRYDGRDRTESLEKRRTSGSSSGHVHGFPYVGSQQAHAPQMDPPLHGYYQPFPPPPSATSRQPPPNAPLPPRSPYNVPPLPPTPVPSTQESDFNCNPNGGANLIRKYSDRKPVPPLLPNPVHDPSRRLTLPQQFCPHSLIQPPSPAAVSPAEMIPGHSAMHPEFESSTAYSMEDPYGGILRVVNQ